MDALGRSASLANEFGAYISIKVNHATYGLPFSCTIDRNTGSLEASTRAHPAVTVRSKIVYMVLSSLRLWKAVYGSITFNSTRFVNER